MKRSFLLLCLTLLLCSFARADSLPTSTKALHAGSNNYLPLNGPVKCVRTDTTINKYVDGKLAAGCPACQSMVIRYNKSGDLTDCDIYGPYPLGWRYAYTYSPSGKLTELRESSCTNPREPKRVYELTSRYTYAYDDQGNETQECTYSKDGTLTSTLSSAYGPSGLPTESTFTQPQGRTSATQKVIYDSKGRETQIDCVASEGGAQITKITYDPSGNSSEFCEYNKDGKLTGREVKETIGKLTKRTYYRAGVKAWTIVREGDRKITEQYFTSDGSIGRTGTYTYKNDSHGNSVEATECRLEYKDGKLKSKLYQTGRSTIEYYR